MNDEGMPRGDIGGWATSSGAVLNQYKKYLSFVKECSVGVNGCYGQNFHLQLYSINDSSWGNHPMLILSDGTQLFFVHRSNNCTGSFGLEPNVCSTIGVDINGAKSPNIWGRDFFIFVIKADGIHPVGYDYEIRCPDSGGYDCAAKVLRENAMNY